MLYFPTSPLYYLAKQENFSLKYMKNTLPINNALNHSSVSYFDWLYALDTIYRKEAQHPAVLLTHSAYTESVMVWISVSKLEAILHEARNDKQWTVLLEYS